MSVVIGSEMRKLVQDYNWAKTSLGPLNQWPQSLRTVIDLVLNSPVAMTILWGSDGVMLYNDAYAEFAAARHPSLLGSKVLEGWPEAAELNQHVLHEGFAGRTLSYTDQPLELARHGVLEQTWLTLDYSPIYSDDKTIGGVLAIVTETTQRVLAEAKLKAAEQTARTEQQKLTELFNDAPAYVAVLHGPEHVFTIANPLYLTLVGQRPIIGQAITQALPELVGSGLYELLHKVYTTGKAYVGTEIPVELDRHNNGTLELGFFNFNYQPIRDVQGAVTDIYVHAIEVTEQVEARKNIEEIATINQVITKNATTALFIMDETLHCTFMNPAAEKMTGYSFEEIVRKKDTLHDIIHYKKPDGAKYIGKDCPINKALSHKKGVRTEDMFVRRDGSLYPVYYVVTPLLSEGTMRGAVMEVRDTTEAKKAQAELSRTKQMFDALFNSRIMAIAMVDLSGTILQANKTFLKLFGYSARDFKAGLTSKQISLSSEEDITKRIYRSLERHGESDPVEKNYRRKDGSTFPALIGAAMLPGSKDQFMAFILDVSETEKLKELNDAKDEFVALASHQLRTPATSVKQYLGILIDEYAGPVNEDQLQYLNIANNANERQLTIIEDLLKTAQIDIKGYSLTSIRQKILPVVNEVIGEYRPYVEQRNQTIVFDEPKQPITMSFDKLELATAIANLIENASKYSPAHTTIKIVVRKNEHFVTIAVADQGVGIAPNDQIKIFEKFTRVNNALSDTVNGNGLGLYWVKRIVELHQGKITISSKLAKGTTFTIHLPV
jgi:PAS domain S-box-containing protein